MTLPQLANEIIALDLETTGLNWWEHQIFGVALATRSQGDHYWDVRQDPWVLEWLRDELPRAKRWVNHNIKFDILFLLAAGVPVWSLVNTGRVDCTMIRAALINEHELTYDLDRLAKKYLKKGKYGDIYADLAAQFGGRVSRSAQMPNLQKADPELVRKYAVPDARLALDLWIWQEDEIEKQDLHKVADLEARLLPVVLRMEIGGVRVDVTGAERAILSLTDEIENLQGRLNAIAGFEVNPNPSASIHKLFAPRQLVDGSWSMVDGTPLESTPAGKPSINADALRRSKHPAAEVILSLRQALRARDTFLEGHVLGYHQDGVIHCNFNQTKGDNEAGTGTGRFSVTTPALQQIPKRNKKVAAIVRSLFIPDPDTDWCCADWSGFEFRWFAHYSKSQPLIDAYRRDPNADFHGMVAGMTGLPRVMTPGIKGNAKQINLGLVFGMGEGKMAEEMGLPFTWEEMEGGRKYRKAGQEAKAVFERYHQAVPGVREYLHRASSVAKERGYVMTAMGRHLRFPNGQFTHKAGGLVLQGTSADCMKQKMIELDQYQQAYPDRFRMMLTVHDENNLSIQRNRPDVVEDIRNILESFGPDSPIPCRVPIRTDPTVAENWWEASKD